MKSILSAVIGATLALSAIEAGAQATPGERQVSLTIESASLATALDKWAQQSGFQIFVQDWEAAKNLRAPSLNGTFAAQDALERLLSGTSLTYVWIDSKTVSIHKKMARTMPTALQRTSLDGQPGIPVAKFSGDDGVGGSISLAAAASEGSGNSATDLRPRSERVEEVVIVTGTYIRGAPNNTVPVTVLDRAYINSTGISTTAALLESLPQNFALASQSGIAVPGVSDGPVVQGASINLRGIGEGTTLTLINGRRMALGFVGQAADISALPLSAIDRVEVLTDGASALYGSDAVGGVVNFILRKDFEGVETRLRSGWADGGVHEYRFGQTLGRAWSSGSALVSAEYYKRDLLEASDRKFVPTTSDVGSLFPEDKTYSALLTGRQQLSDSVGFFTDALYTKRYSYNKAGLRTFEKDTTSRNPQVLATVGLNWTLGGDWALETSGSHAYNEVESVGRAIVSDTSPYGVPRVQFNSRFAIDVAQVKADGTVLTLPAGNVQMAIGAERRWESYKFSVVDAVARDFDQTVTSAFTELRVPLVGSDPVTPRGHRLELSMAGRFDDYSNFGSSFDPTFGLMWRPTDAVRLRGSYGTSYVAPKLPNYTFGDNYAVSSFSPDPTSPTGISNQLQVYGIDVDELAPQEATSLSFGFDVTPVSAPNLEASLNYYRIEYRGRIAAPPFPTVMLSNPSSYGGLIIRNPSLAQVDDYIALGNLGFPFQAYDPDFNLIDDFDPATVELIIDGRTRNLSETLTSGLDASLKCGFAWAGGEALASVSGTYVFELSQRVTSKSSSFDLADTFYNPPNFRVRGSFGWQGFGWNADLFVNYTDSYTDNRLTIPVAVSSYATIDTRLAYDFKERSESGILSGLVVAVSVQNLLDRDPPRTVITSPFDMGFDPTNSSPMGRFVALELTKSW